jgi:MarR family 2-MHQ and catechol resistance regulon transcriptional repressor
MTPFDRNVTALRDLVGDIVQQSRVMDEASADGPHAELSMKEMLVIEHLGDKGPRMMKEVAEYLLLAVNSVTTLVDNLEARGLVQRQRSEEDRRKVHVTLTESGQQVYTAALEDKVRCLRNMLAALTEDEQEIFLVLFRKIARAGWAQVQQMKMGGRDNPSRKGPVDE